MNGKSKCKILKQIRKQIAENNDIELITSECKHQGDCLGTCPKCEQEVRYLEQELNKRSNIGKTVVLAGISAALVSSLCACDYDVFNPLGNSRTAGDMPIDTEASMSTTAGVMPVSETETETSAGELLESETESEALSVYQLDGDIAYITDETESMELLGEIPLENEFNTDN